MKNVVIVLVMCLMVYQGYAQQKSHIVPIFYPQMSDTIEWTEYDIINILKKGKILFCKLDDYADVKNPNAYEKNIEIMLENDSIFYSAYLESCIFYNKKNKKNVICEYLIINDRFGNKLELTPDALVYLPILSEYLNKKIRKTHTKECKDYVFLD